jgi:hypothetical protein
MDDREAVTRALARHQWVREHGTPRVSTLVGEPAEVRAIWRAWLERPRHEAARADALTLAAPVDGDEGWLGRAAAEAFAAVGEAPARCVAILVDAARLEAWLAARCDRLAAFIAEGVIDVTAAAPAAGARPGPAPAAARPVPAIAPRPRSAAEAAMLAALEAVPATAGRFQLNQALSFAFGERAAEVDLVSRADAIAIEIDGYHHFTDPDHYRRDRRKDLLLQAHGYVVLRFLADDVLDDPRAAVDAVIELLGVRQGRAARQGRP